MAKAAMVPFRLVLDTNIVISALLWQGAPRMLLDQASGDNGVELYASEALIDELRNSLGYRKFEKRLAGAGMSVDAAVLLYRALMHSVTPTAVSGLVPRDPKDDVVAGTAIAARAHAIVSGDKDLTTLERVAGISVLRAGEALELMRDRTDVRQ
jgi:putative PIN family toxin of toxin-antitoxin system